MCRQKTVSTIEDHPDSAFLDTLCNNTTMWTSEVNVNGEKIPFKLDTGAEVTAISKETWKVLGEPTLQPSAKHARVYQSWESSVVTFHTRDNILSTQSLWWIATC